MRSEVRAMHPHAFLVKTKVLYASPQRSVHVETTIPSTSQEGWAAAGQLIPRTAAQYLSMNVNFGAFTVESCILS